MPDWTSGDEDERLSEWAGVGHHKLARGPRPPQRGTSLPLPRVIRCFDDCEAQQTGDPDACECAERTDIAWDAEMDARYDRQVDRDEKESE